ncbi:MAG: FAD-binding protein, partial [Pseudomonadota bacterium]
LDVDEVLTPFDTLNDYFELAPEADAQNEYAVAWLDQLNGERGVLMTANHAKAGRAQTGNHRPMVGVPVNLPFNALNSWSLRAFNTAFRLSKMRHAGEEKRAPWQSYFYPLDAVGQWNRLYGPGGLFQHQSVIPFQTARDAIPALLQVSKKAGQASFLTVLKRFGDVVSPGLLSFPKPGYTLTLDFPNKGQSTLNLLDTLDRITMEAGGRVNPYKDARMSRSVFQKGFASWEELEAMRDPVIMSDFWRRVAN